MSKQISHEETEKIAMLARLALTQEEMALAASYLSQVLDYADRLSRVPTENVQPYVPEGVPLPALRQDAAAPFDGRDALLAAAVREADLVVARGIAGMKTDGSGLLKENKE